MINKNPEEGTNLPLVRMSASIEDAPYLLRVDERPDVVLAASCRGDDIAPTKLKLRT